MTIVESLIDDHDAVSNVGVVGSKERVTVRAEKTILLSVTAFTFALGSQNPARQDPGRHHVHANHGTERSVKVSFQLDDCGPKDRSRRQYAFGRREEH